MKLPLPRRLRSRLAFKQTATFALLAILIAWSAYVLLARRIYDQLDAELQDRAVAVRSMLQVHGSEVHWINKEADSEVRDQFDHSIRYYELVDSHARALETSPEMAALNLPWSAASGEALDSGRSTRETVTSGSGFRLRVLNFPVLGEQRHYLLKIGIPLAQADEDTARLGLCFLLFLPLVLLIHWLNSWLLAAAELRPLERIASVARQMAPLDMNGRLPVTGNGDEIDQLGSALNATLARLQGSLQRMSEFLRNLCHEIRQPLTVMRAETEQALRAGVSDENYRDMLSSQLEHVQLLARTVSDLMELAQSDDGQIKLHCEREDLSELVQSALDGMKAKAAEQGIHLSGTVQQNVIGEVDAGQIWRLVLNLLDNAIKYNHPNGRVDVKLSAHGGVALLSVSDTGCGIAAEEQHRVFERGYRVTSARKSAQGTGLGLHFARNIVRAHGGEIEISSHPGQGSSFLVSLPLVLGMAEPASDLRDTSVQ
jgi:two-component system OmpR family sensor kinase